MASDDRGPIVVTRKPLRGPRRREVYKPREGEDRWTRVEYVWGGCDWHYAGTEIQESLDVECGAVVDALEGPVEP